MRVFSATSGTSLRRTAGPTVPVSVVVFLMSTVCFTVAVFLTVLVIVLGAFTGEQLRGFGGRGAQRKRREGWGDPRGETRTEIEGYLGEGVSTR